MTVDKTIRWIYGTDTESERIKLEGDFFNKTFNVRINDVTVYDEGTYLCQINTKPMTSTNVSLIVQGMCHLHLRFQSIYLRHEKRDDAK